jgi:hypothetical protein
LAQTHTHQAYVRIKGEQASLLPVGAGQNHVQVFSFGAHPVNLQPTAQRGIEHIGQSKSYLQQLGQLTTESIEDAFEGKPKATG